MSLGRVLILGGGPTGLAAAHRLKAAGHEDFLVLEREIHLGGLSRTDMDAVGFSWDYGSHVFFSSDPQYDAALNAWLHPDEWYTRQRDTRVWLERKFWPYPIQQQAEALSCVPSGPREPMPAGPVRFDAYLSNEFGPDLTRLFFRPTTRRSGAIRLRCWMRGPSRIGLRRPAASLRPGAECDVPLPEGGRRTGLAQGGGAVRRARPDQHDGHRLAPGREAGRCSALEWGVHRLPLRPPD